MQYIQGYYSMERKLASMLYTRSKTVVHVGLSDMITKHCGLCCPGHFPPVVVRGVRIVHVIFA